MLDLASIFGDWLATDPEAPATARRQPQGHATAPEAHAPALGPTDAADISTWQPGSDFRGRLGWEPAALPEAVAWWRWSDFDDLPDPDWACPGCGGLLWWGDLRGGRHCPRCKAAKAERADRLVAKASRLRQRAGLRCA